MATSEPGGGMAELLDKLAHDMVSAPEFNPNEVERMRHIFDVVLDELDGAGYVVLDRERALRLRDAAAIYAADLLDRCEGYVGASRQCTMVLGHGDLDQIP